ncbi:dihydrofolate reductase [Cellulosimicrobium terreum]|nr:dihydrofolate reductase [Cellulosimicrobium terreum]
MLGLIWAQARDSAGRPVIGAGGAMPWRLPEDSAHFRGVTSGHPVVMGRRTWESLPPRFRPLPGRTNVVVTRQADWVPDGDPAARTAPDLVRVAGSVETALAVAREVARNGPADLGDQGRVGEVWVIGGAQLYTATVEHADRCVVTEIDTVVEGDTYAPDVPVSWHRAPGEWLTSTTGLRYRFVVLTRP